MAPSQKNGRVELPKIYETEQKSIQLHHRYRRQ